MDYTKNYNLKKPSNEDFYNVEDFNSNVETVDNELNKLEKIMGSIEQKSFSFRGIVRNIDKINENGIYYIHEGDSTFPYPYGIVYFGKSLELCQEKSIIFLTTGNDDNMYRNNCRIDDKGKYGWLGWKEIAFTRNMIVNKPIPEKIKKLSDLREPGLYQLYEAQNRFEDFPNDLVERGLVYGIIEVLSAGYVQYRMILGNCNLSKHIELTGFLTTKEAGGSVLDYIKWVELASVKNISNPNILINGDFKVWQRGTSIDVLSGERKFTSDRWQVSNTLGLNGKIRVYKHLPTDGGQSYLVMQNESNNGGTAVISYGLEEIDVSMLRGKKVTLSFEFHTKNEDILLTSFARYSEFQEIQAPSISSEFNIFSKTDLGSKTWKKVEVSFVVPSKSKGLSLAIYPTFLSNRINDFLAIKSMKLEIGEIASPFSPRPYGEELALCRRYFKKISGTIFPKFVTNDKRSIIFDLNDLVRYMREGRTFLNLIAHNSFSLYSMYGLNATNWGSVYTVAQDQNGIVASKNVDNTTPIESVGAIYNFSIDAEIY